MCKVDSCLNKPQRKGYCDRHYRDDYLAIKKVCSVISCGGRHHAKGLCRVHYGIKCVDHTASYYRKKSSGYRRNYSAKKRRCDLESCKKPHHSKGLCINHYHLKYVDLKEKYFRNINSESYKINLKKNRFRNNVSSAIRLSLKGMKCGRSWESLVGYTLVDLKSHLESLFVASMNWDNYGEWHIDHIIPQSRFNFNDAEDIDFKLCWSLDNLQPLWAKDNIYKSDNIDKPFQPSLAIAKVGIYVK